ncbi:hypothetical protein ACTSKR_11385 [Chitinibacteraceae bacterium HSL-7]
MSAFQEGGQWGYELVGRKAGKRLVISSAHGWATRGDALAAGEALLASLTARAQQKGAYRG